MGEGKAQSTEAYAALNIEAVDVPQPAFYGLEADTNGFIIRRLAEFKDRHFQTNAFQLFYAVLLYVTNIILQVCVIAYLLVAGEWMEKQWKEPKFSQAHNMTMSEAIEALSQGSESHEASAPSHIIEACKPTLDMVSLNAYYLLVFVWITNMMSEFKGIRRFTMAVMQIEAQTDPQQPIFSADGKTIVRIDRMLRCFILIGVTGVRLIIAFPLMYAGIKFLMLQTSTMALIMKVLAMRMVVAIDSQLIDNLVTKAAVNEVSNTELQFIPGKGSKTFQKIIDGTEGMVYYVATLLVLVVVVTTRFGTLMAFRRSCRGYYDAHHDVPYSESFWDALTPAWHEI